MLIIAHFQRYRRCCKSFLSERFFLICGSMSNYVV